MCWVWNFWVLILLVWGLGDLSQVLKEPFSNKGFHTSLPSRNGFQFLRRDTFTSSYKKKYNVNDLFTYMQFHIIKANLFQSWNSKSVIHFINRMMDQNTRCNSRGTALLKHLTPTAWSFVSLLTSPILKSKCNTNSFWICAFILYIPYKNTPRNTTILKQKKNS